AKTCTLKRLLSFFGYERRLLMDKEAKMIRLHIKKWWLINKVTEFPFSRVRGILYRHDDQGTSWSVNPFWMGRTDSIEYFSVAFALIDPKENLPLFSFIGEGATETGLRGVVLGGDSVLDFQGTQSEDSRRFVKALEEFLSVTLLTN
ncbi:MAG: hypothetical protein OQK80_10465, partial [Sedimenticola sp.]|nr:hypothetical protein [Sedimenticola sp.]